MKLVRGFIAAECEVAFEVSDEHIFQKLRINYQATSDLCWHLKQTLRDVRDNEAILFKRCIV